MMGVPFPALKTMVTVVLLLMGNMSPVHPIDPATVTVTVASVAASVITAGVSLAGTSLGGLGDPDSSVTCAIQVENWTRYALVYPTVRTKGYPGVTSAPSAILPTKQEAFAVRKPKLTATGTWGTVSWEIEGLDRRLVVMWSTPYNFNHYSNWMGVGMTREGLTNVAPGNAWLDQMYYGKNSADLTFKRGEFYENVIAVTYRNDKFEIEGTMTNIHKAQVKVTLRPTISNWKDTALPIQELVVEREKDICDI